MIIRCSCRSSFRSLLPFHSQNSRHISRPPRSIRGKKRGKPLIYIAPYVLGAQPFKSFRPGTPPAGLLPFGIRPAFVRCGPFAPCVLAKLSLHVQPLRAAVVRPGFRLRFCASGCLPCFAFSALPGLFPGLSACARYIYPAACLCALPASLSGLPSLPFSIRAAACCSASALPSTAAGLCLPKEVKAARLPAVVCFAASLPALALPGLPGIRTKSEGRPALLCVSAAP